MKKIILYPDKSLREVAPRITKVDKTLLTEIEDLKKLLDASENGAGLAASQLGINKRFFGIKDSKKKQVDIFINPRIVGYWGEKTFPKLIGEEGKDEDFLEGCLSFPDFYGTVKRYLKIMVEWEKIEGNELKTEKATIQGFEAIVFQHEGDHLDGILFIDHVKEDGGKFYKWGKKKKIVWEVEKLFSDARLGGNKR